MVKLPRLPIRIWGNATASRFVEAGPTYCLDWVVWAILGQPVGTREWQWAASGGNIPVFTAKSASTRSIHIRYWDRPAPGR
jgi:hypothetical protein